MMRRLSTIAGCAAALCGSLLLAIACAERERVDSQAARPNVLWVVWDTVRADRLSLYGYEKPTTPNLDRWAQQARVFEDALSASCSTLPSHASMFTGLLPSQHGTSSAHHRLDGRHVTLGELFRDAGYRTYLWSSNPYVSGVENFTQGFEVERHPWDRELRRQAMQLSLSKRFRSADEARSLDGKRVARWSLASTGALAAPDLEAWLDSGDASKPFFAFVNYMEAHWPYIPPKRHRERLMSPEHVEASYAADSSWVRRWGYTFGLEQYSSEELAITASAYDAALAELDELFAALLSGLESRGHLDDTIIVLTADHGELLGEHHLLDHQFSLYQPVVHVPLIIYYPAQLKAGRERRPVMNFDLFPTLLELAGISPPVGVESKAVSLLRPESSRIRLVEYPARFTQPFAWVRRDHPDWDSAPWDRRLRAVYEGDHKLIRAEDGSGELYDIARDPLERQDRYQDDPLLTQRLEARLQAFVQSLGITEGPSRLEPVPQVSEAHLERLRALGYEAPAEPTTPRELE